MSRERIVITRLFVAKGAGNLQMVRGPLLVDRENAGTTGHGQLTTNSQSLFTALRS